MSTTAKVLYLETIFCMGYMVLRPCVTKFVFFGVCLFCPLLSVVLCFPGTYVHWPIADEWMEPVTISSNHRFATYSLSHLKHHWRVERRKERERSIRLVRLWCACEMIRVCVSFPDYVSVDSPLLPVGSTIEMLLHWLEEKGIGGISRDLHGAHLGLFIHTRFRGLRHLCNVGYVSSG